MQTEELHPFQYYIPAGSTTLFIGTFPPSRRNWSYEFFYPNKQNLFWKIIAAIAGKNLLYFEGHEAVEERQQLLRQLNAGVTDMGLLIARQHQSSLDEDLTALAYMDIIQLLEANPCINKLLFTSSSGSSSAAGWFEQYLTTKQITHRFPKGRKPLHSSIGLANRPVKLVILFSPSRRAANRISFEELVQMYRDELVPA